MIRNVLASATKENLRARAQSGVAEGARARNRTGAIMTELFFDHDRFDV